MNSNARARRSLPVPAGLLTRRAMAPLRPPTGKLLI